MRLLQYLIAEAASGKVRRSASARKRLKALLLQEPNLQTEQARIDRGDLVLGETRYKVRT